MRGLNILNICSILSTRDNKITCNFSKQKMNERISYLLNYLHKRTLLFTFHELIYVINLDYYFNP